MMHWIFSNYGMGYGHGMGFFMFFFWFLIVLGVILLVKTLLGEGEKMNHPRNGDDSAEEILKKRYARGEINDEEFRRMMDRLKP